MERDGNTVHICRCHGSDIGMQRGRVTRLRVFLDYGDIGRDEGLGPAHIQLEVKVHVTTGVAVCPIVYVGRRGNVEEEEVVVEIVVREGRRRRRRGGGRDRLPLGNANGGVFGGVISQSLRQ